MSNFGDLLQTGGGVARYAAALPKILRLLELAREADELIGELRETFGKRSRAEPASPATSASIEARG